MMRAKYWNPSYDLCVAQELMHMQYSILIWNHSFIAQLNNASNSSLSTTRHLNTISRYLDKFSQPYTDNEEGRKGYCNTASSCSVPKTTFSKTSFMQLPKNSWTLSLPSLWAKSEIPWRHLQNCRNVSTETWTRMTSSVSIAQNALWK